MKVKNMYSPNGNKVANQFVITTENAEIFQSYNTVIAIKHNDGTVELDTAWDYSRTTSKYRNIFLGETTKETQKHIKSGEYQVTNLNN
tara:strand:- start:972 stop:1235 length:264 start_codon:yes stop_codon:yes gene_type:complete